MITAENKNKPSYPYIGEGRRNDYLLSEEDCNTTVYKYIKDRNDPSEIAVIYNGTEITYGELFEEADLIADRLWNVGIRPGMYVLTMFECSPHITAFLLAASKIGVCTLSLTTQTREELVRGLLNISDISMFFVMEKNYVQFSEMKCLDELDYIITIPKTYKKITEKQDNRPSGISNIMKWDDFMSGPKTSSPEMVDGYYPLNIMATSGSTGNPKGIVHTNITQVALIKIFADAECGWKRGDRMFSMFPPYVATGVSLSLLTPLALGISVIQRLELSQKVFVDVLKNDRPNIILAPKSTWLTLPEAAPDGMDLSFIHSMVTAGEPIYQTEMGIFKSYLEKNGCYKVPDNGYGMSECNSLVSMAQNLQKEIFSSAGFVLNHVVISVFDFDKGRECDYGELGEICCISPANMQNYFMNRHATKEFYFFDDHGLRWARSGDVGYITSRGEIVICCREKEKFTDKNGAHVYPFEVERIVNELPNVTRSKALKMKYNGEEALSIHFTLSETPDDVEAFCKQIIEACKKSGLAVLPTLFKYRTGFPLNKGGKMDMVAMANETDGFIAL
ncbi:MAG: acyl--CoA ligase [Clostridia bacterium]|nr:acyl--CoA ligase [Clostridia bacterium]